MSVCFLYGGFEFSENNKVFMLGVKGYESS